MALQKNKPAKTQSETQEKESENPVKVSPKSPPKKKPSLTNGCLDPGRDPDGPPICDD